MKKLTSIAALLAAMIMLVSCGGQQASAPAPTENPETAVRATVSGFLDSVFDYDLEKAKDYATDNAIDQIESELNMDKLLSAADSDALDMFPKETIENFMEKIIKVVFNNATYDIKNVEIDGDKATVNVSLGIIDTNAIDFNDIADYEDIMEEAFGFDMNEDPMVLIEKYAEKKGVAVDELISSMTSGDQSDFLKDLFSTFDTEVEKMFDIMCDKVEEVAKTADKTETDGTVTLEKQSDGTWKVTSTD